MRHLFLFLFIWLSLLSGQSQIVTLNPTGANPDQPVTIIFDASQGNKELLGASKVYMHHGAITDRINGTTWKYVKGNWGKDDGIGLMSRVPGETNKWQYSLNPDIRSYFGVPAGENIFRISCVFRNADGSVKGTIAPGEYGWGTVASNNDIFINLNNTNYLSIINPVENEGFVNKGEALNIQAVSSSNVTEMKIWLDEGSGYTEKAAVSAGKTINFNYTPSASLDLGIRITALVNGQTLMVSKKYTLVIKNPSMIAPLPTGVKSGANYHKNDPTKVTLVLLAPYKEFVYVVGDFSDWKIKELNQMKKTPDGQYYWIELEGLTPGKEYVYQYWIDEKLKVADPYTRQVADPWNDKYIESSVFPGLPAYTREDLGIASVFRTNQSDYQWDTSEISWKKPDLNHLVIYELHLRDFLASHSYKDLTDTISYLKRLGVNAIELMPINEFEGNDSWGYNPSFYFAHDKYYGTKNQLKKFVEIAHQHGLAVIQDMVLNHSFGQSPMVKMYFEGGKPAANNPWYNREYVGQYQWGYDFNHESIYTKNFIDDVNRYWIEEFHIDGYRFDFTKGFTNYAPGGSVDGFDQSRINILKRMADKIWQVDPKAYIILEHWSPDAEETQLGNYGMKMWRNKSYDFVPATIGSPTGSFTNTDATTHVTFYNSHDERRIAEHCITEGVSTGSYDIKDSLIMFERVKLAAAFMFLQPGPKMLWQFDELGYDIDINFNGRIGRKPYVWGNGSLKYYNSQLRQNIYQAYKGILDVRVKIGPDLLKAAQKSHQLTGDVRRLSYNTTNIDLVVLGNFGMSTKSIDPKFSQTGKWYNYFSGDSINVTNINTPINLKAGEWHIYTTKRLGNGQPEVNANYSNPVTITPYPFSGKDLIKIRFDAFLASPGGTAGLVASDKVYMHAGVILSNATNNTLTNTVGTLTDDGIGQMTKLSQNIWELTITPNDYFKLTQGKEILKIGMWFRNGDNTRRGYGFRDGIIYFNVTSDLPMVTINPQVFTRDTEITITMDASKGNRQLMGADKVYLHSGVGVINTNTPQNSAWNKVVGNWGQDDGVGRMTKIAGEANKWQIKLTPSSYYNLSPTEFPYWIAAVFRNSTGSVKGTGTPGTYDFGIIDTNQDFFLKNAYIVNAEQTTIEDMIIYPNPASGNIYFKGYDTPFNISILNTNGQETLRKNQITSESLDISALPPGLYFYKIVKDTSIKSGKLIITK